MVRLFKSYAEQCLLLMTWCHDQGFTVSGGIARDLQDRYGRDLHKELNKAVYSALQNQSLKGSGSVSSAGSIKLLEDLAKALNSEYRSDIYDGELIDQIVKVLQIPYARNVLSGATLTKLATAILVPEEMIGLTDRLKKKEMSCASCGHEFAEGEIGSIWSDGSGKRVWNCTKCTQSTVTACVQCGKSSHSFADRLKNIFKGGCDSCNGKKKGKEKIEAGGLFVGAEVEIGGDGEAVDPLDQQPDEVLADYLMRRRARDIGPAVAAPANRQGVVGGRIRQAGERVRAMDNPPVAAQPDPMIPQPIHQRNYFFVGNEPLPAQDNANVVNMNWDNVPLGEQAPIYQLPDEGGN